MITMEQAQMITPTSVESINELTFVNCNTADEQHPSRCVMCGAPGCDKKMKEAEQAIEVRKYLLSKLKH